MVSARVGCRRGRRRDGGAAAVEFALVVPILLLLVFAIIQFGFILAQQNALNGAVRTGARYGTVNAFSGSHTCGNVVTRVQETAHTIGVDTAQVYVDVRLAGESDPVCTSDGGGDLTETPCTDSNATAAAPRNLTVYARFDSDFLVPVPLTGSSMRLESEGVYQCEYH